MMDAQEYRSKFHPLANTFPLIYGDEFGELIDDIKAHGLREPIVRFEGLILDGRNRFLACERVSVEPRFVEFQGTYDDAVAFVISANLRRRHLDESQRAAVAARIANLKHGGDRRSDQGANLPTSPVTIATAAKMMRVSERSVKSARSVIEKGIPEVVSAVDRGEASVSAAAKFVKRPEAEQRASLTKHGNAAEAVRNERKRPEASSRISGIDDGFPYLIAMAAFREIMRIEKTVAVPPHEKMKFEAALHGASLHLDEIRDEFGLLTGA